MKNLCNFISFCDNFTPTSSNIHEKIDDLEKTVLNQNIIERKIIVLKNFCLSLSTYISSDRFFCLSVPFNCFFFFFFFFFFFLRTKFYSFTKKKMYWTKVSKTQKMQNQGTLLVFLI